MRFHWLRDHILQNQFNMYWDKGVNNDADYFTKHHSPAHHQIMRPKYINMINLSRNARHG